MPHLPSADVLLCAMTSIAYVNVCNVAECIMFFGGFESNRDRERERENRMC